MKYCLSKFTRMINAENGDIIIFNTYTGKQNFVFDEIIKRQIEMLRSFPQEEKLIDSRLLSYFCVPEGTDENLLVFNNVNNFLNSSESLSLILFPTLDCNFACTYCYENKEKGFMLDETYDKLFAAIKKHHEENHIKFLKLEWFGGEPLLCYDKLIEFTKEVNDFCDSEKIIYQHSIAYLFGINVEKQFYYKTNRLRYENYLKALFEIKSTFDKYKLNYIVFKGVVLANIIYDNPSKRYVGDLDVYVDKEGYSTALMILIKIGYEFRNNSTFYNEHHIVMVRDSITIELHKFIYNPQITINESFLRENTQDIQVAGQSIRTFNITASFLHLVYHLYMDSWLAWNNAKSILATGHFPKTTRFLYRAYEIALFSEQYYDIIDWSEIKKDIETQRFRELFKKMIIDIVDIFPNAFPHDMLELICQKEYVRDGKDCL